MRILAEALFVHSVEVAKECDEIDDILVSSDSDVILDEPKRPEL